jgi:photosystem II stability/assembly factor-like uncharacterized protein
VGSKTQYSGVSVFFSTDYGGQWIEKQLVSYEGIYDVFFLDSLNGWTCGVIAEVWHTTDRGASWQWQGLGMSYLATRIQFQDPTHGWIACGAAIMGRWDESAQCWMQVFLPYPEFPYDTVDFQGVSFADTLHGWLCAGRYSEADTMAGGQGFIAYTADGCSTWTCQVRDTVNDYYDIDFIDRDDGIAVGGNDRTMAGYIARTTDGGQAWIGQVMPTAGFLRGLDFPDARHGWAVGKSGTVLNTSDGGSTWSAQVSGTDSILYDVDFADSLHGIASGADVVLLTSDGGNTWVRSRVGVAETPPPVGDAPRILTVNPSLARGPVQIDCGLPTGAGASVAIFDGLGRLVRTLRVPDCHALSWDGCDERGRSKAAGIYLIRLTSDHMVASGRIIYLR